MKQEQKQTIKYDDVKLETKDQDQLDQMEEDRVQKILAETLEENMISGELILKIIKGNNLTEINGKEKFAFQVQMPRYDAKGKLLPI